jgi:hypothetical protein
MTPHVEVFVGPDHDLVHTSLVLTGFCELASRGVISLRYCYPKTASERWLIGDPIVIVCDVHGGQTTRMAIDLRDGEGISEPIVDRVRWYFKRSFYAPERESLVPERRERMLAFGLNFPCRSRRSSARLLAALGGPIALSGRAGIQRLRHYLSTPPPSMFERDPGAPVEPWIHFQPRLWSPEEAPGEWEGVNADRVKMVRALKREFGKRFVGGLVATAYASRHYPDDLTPHSSKYADYLRLKQRCLIGIYTRGLEHSLAFKLSETFAASQCLVSVPLRYELPSPLVAGRHYLEFETPDACIAACHRLLAEDALARSMRQVNHDYYVREIEPAAHLRRVIDRATASSAAS